jgi:hypothetical protein
VKQGEILKGLRSAHAKLVKAKAAFEPGPDREYEEPVVEAKRSFIDWYFRASEHGLDATGLVLELNKKLA